VKGRKQKVKGGGPRYSKKQCRDSIAGKVKEKKCKFGRRDGTTGHQV
jgi:hypothetical protein